MSAINDRFHQIVTQLEHEEHHLAAEARAVYEKLHAHLRKVEQAPTAPTPAPAQPPAGS